MKAIFDAKILADAINAVATAVAARTTKPALAQVKLTVRSGGATVAATDTEVSVRRFVDVKSDDELVALIDPKKSGDWLKEQKGDVIVSVKDEEILLSVGQRKLRLPYMNPDEFPDVEESASNGAKLVLPFRQLAELLERAEFATEKKEAARWAVTGVLMRSHSSGLYVVATDTKRLSYSHIAGDFPQGESKVPTKATGLILKNGGSDTTEVTVTLGSNAATFRTDEWFLNTRLVEGKFPPFEQIIPKKLQHTAEVKASEFAKAVREAAIASDAQSKRVEFNFANEECVMTARSEGCAGESQCPVPGFDANVQLAMDPQYVLEGIKVIDKNAIVRIRMTDETKPVLFEYGDEWTYLIMPMSNKE